MDNRRQYLIEVFKQTMITIDTNATLAMLTEKGKAATRFYDAGYCPILPQKPV